MAESFCAKQAGRWCTVTASSPSTRRGVLDGGDTPHEPRLHWSTSASTRRTLTPGIRQVGLQSSLNRSRSRFEVVDNRAILVGRFTNQFSRTQFANRRFNAGSPDFVHGSRFAAGVAGGVGSRITLHGSRTRELSHISCWLLKITHTDSGRGLVRSGSRFTVHDSGVN